MDFLKICQDAAAGCEVSRDVDEVVGCRGSQGSVYLL